jgi:serine palmitoyltransferase
MSKVCMPRLDHPQLDNQSIDKLDITLKALSRPIRRSAVTKSRSGLAPTRNFSMTMKSRFSRLLRGKSRFRKNSSLKEDDSPSVETAEISSTSSGILSHCDDDSMSVIYGPSGDPYADVRDRLEELSTRDKAGYLCGNTDAISFHKHEEPMIPFFIAYTVYMSYAALICVGHIRDFLAYLFQRGRYLRVRTGYPSDNNAMFAPLLKSWENFYTRRLYTRVQDAFNRPIATNPGAHIHVLERVSYDQQKSMQILESIDHLDTDGQRQTYMNGQYYVETADGKPARRCINLGSYNYLGFADDWQTTCAREVKGSLTDLSISVSSSRSEYGTTKIHREVEETVAAFVGKEDALAFNMGFNTNATTIPALLGRGDLLISDELNHTSIVNGARASGAAIRTFRHNDIENLEEILRETIIMGRPRTRRPWNKIMVVVEGIYSMEGEYCDLKNVVRVSKKYGAYVYLDEAHSIGAMGATGRGCTEYTGVDTSDIDIMMGTFTKSFGGMGGYIAASKDIIAYLRQRCAGSSYHNALSPVVCQQVLTAFKVSYALPGQGPRLEMFTLAHSYPLR